MHSRETYVKAARQASTREVAVLLTVYRLAPWQDEHNSQMTAILQAEKRRRQQEGTWNWFEIDFVRLGQETVDRWGCEASHEADAISQFEAAYPGARIITLVHPTERDSTEETV